jgi:hypothetical protein
MVEITTSDKKIKDRQYTKRWREAHKEQARIYMLQYRRTANYKKYRQKYNKQWWQENKEQDTARHKMWYLQQKSFINWERRIKYRKARETVFHVLGQHCCVKCGFHDKRALQFDHINGGGSKQHRVDFLNKRVEFYLYYAYHPEEARRTLQVMCSNCNAIKRIEKGEQLKSSL